jgi:hypothetical protein
MQSPKDLMQDIAANHFAQARAAAIIPQSVYILLCNTSPVGAYIHRSTAEYEMHICIQGDDYDLATGKTWINDHTYTIKEVYLTRHKEF